jgi:hypothetical protein
MKAGESDARRGAAIVGGMRPGLWSVIVMLAACSTNAVTGDETLDGHDERVRHGADGEAARR